jgi:hypothetical protein
MGLWWLSTRNTQMKTLNILEIEQVAGGLDDTSSDEIVVVGTRLQEFDFSIYLNSFGGFGSSFESYLPEASMLLGGDFVPFFPYVLPDSDIEDFKEFLKEKTDENPDRLMIDTFKVGEDKFIIEWDANGNGSVWRVTDNTFTDDDFTYFSGINVTGMSATSSMTGGVNASISPSGPGVGVTVSTTNGYTVTFTYTGTGG